MIPQQSYYTTNLYIIIVLKIFNDFIAFRQIKLPNYPPCNNTILRCIINSGIASNILVQFRGIYMLKNRGLFFLILCIFIICFVFYFTTDSSIHKSIPNAKATFISLNNFKYNLTVGESQTLKATINPANEKYKAPKWTSSNTKIVKVDSKGKVAAVGIGNAIITITTFDGSISVNYTFTVISNWVNKNFVTFGDSITWYDGKPYNSGSKEEGVIVKGYQSYMRDKLNCVIDNQGANGNDMTEIYSIINDYNYENIDAVTITSGANDHRKGVLPGIVLPIGSKFKTTNYAGALQSSTKGYERIADILIPFFS